MRGVTSTKCWEISKKEMMNSALGSRKKFPWGSHVWPDNCGMSGDFPVKERGEYFPEKGSSTCLFQGSEWFC